VPARLDMVGVALAAAAESAKTVMSIRPKRL
jgi:hypothetical protein